MKINNIKIEVKKTLHSPHPLIKKSKEILSKQVIDEYGMKRVHSNQGIDIRVSPQQESRALRIMDAVLKWFESNGYKINNLKNSDTCIQDKEAEVTIAIEEKSNFIKKTLIDSFGSYKYYKREYAPEGKLSLMIKNYTWGDVRLRKKWTDNTKKLLEEQLIDFIEGIMKFLEYEYDRIAKRKEEERQREIFRIKREEEIRLQKIEEEKINQLCEESLIWEKTLRIEAYIKAKKLYLVNLYGNNIPEEDQKWLKWANQYVLNLNPFKQ